MIGIYNSGAERSVGQPLDRIARRRVRAQWA
jgi:hypothetical protein